MINIEFRLLDDIYRLKNRCFNKNKYAIIYVKDDESCEHSSVFHLIIENTEPTTSILDRLKKEVRKVTGECDLKLVKKVIDECLRCKKMEDDKKYSVDYVLGRVGYELKIKEID